MAKLIYSMITSLDGYAEAARATSDWAAPTRRCTPSSTTSSAPVGTYLYGRRMYETMVYWETAHTEPDQPPHIVEYARTGRPPRRSSTPRRWSRCRARGPGSSGPSTPTRYAGSRPRPTTTSPSTVRTSRPGDHGRPGGRVPPVHHTSVVGGGKRFFPDGVRLDLELVEERAFERSTRWPCCGTRPLGQRAAACGWMERSDARDQRRGPRGRRRRARRRRRRRRTGHRCAGGLARSGSIRRSSAGSQRECSCRWNAATMLAGWNPDQTWWLTAILGPDPNPSPVRPGAAGSYRHPALPSLEFSACCGPTTGVGRRGSRTPVPPSPLV